MARKHIRALPCMNGVAPTESHSDAQNAGYIQQTLWTMLLVLGYSKLPLFIETPSPLYGNWYLCRVRVVI
jgi:hypothetical protein